MTMNPTQDLVAAVAEFEAVLDEEQAVLRRRDVAELEAIGERKRAVADRLEALERVLGLAAPGDGGLENDQQPLTKLALTGAEKQAFTAMVQRCQRKNRLNGAMLDAGISVNRQLLNIFSGRGAGGETYSVEGRVSDATGGTALTRV